MVALAWLAWSGLAPALARIAPTLVTAAIVVVALEPMVSRLERIGIRRGVSAASLGFALIVLLVCFIAFLSPRAVATLAMVGESLPETLQSLQKSADSLLGRYPALALLDTSVLLQSFSVSLSSALGFAGTAAYLIGSVLAGAVAGAYLTSDLQHIAKMLRSGGRTDNMLHSAQKTFGRYLRGQILLSLFVGVTTGCAAALLSVPRPILIGAVAGITNLVPLLGPIFGGALGAVVALTVGGGLSQALAFIAAVVVIQQVESAVLSPRVLGRSLSVRPSLVIMTITIAGAVGGVTLMAVALPTVVAVREAWKERRQPTTAKE